MLHLGIVMACLHTIIIHLYDTCICPTIFTLNLFLLHIIIFLPGVRLCALTSAQFPYQTLCFIVSVPGYPQVRQTNTPTRHSHMLGSYYTEHLVALDRAYQ